VRLFAPRRFRWLKRREEKSFFEGPEQPPPARFSC
jgi:hypothetical protein